jgi:hypothetical protein
MTQSNFDGDVEDGIGEAIGWLLVAIVAAYLFGAKWRSL